MPLTPQLSTPTSSLHRPLSLTPAGPTLSPPHSPSHPGPSHPLTPPQPLTVPVPPVPHTHLARGPARAAAPPSAPLPVTPGPARHRARPDATAPLALPRPIAAAAGGLAPASPRQRPRPLRAVPPPAGSRPHCASRRERGLMGNVGAACDATRGGALWGRSVLRAAQYGGAAGCRQLAPRPSTPSIASEPLRPQQFAPRPSRASMQDNNPASRQSWEGLTVPRKPVQSAGMLCPGGLARIVWSRQDPTRDPTQGHPYI